MEELCAFTAKTISQRCAKGVRISVEQNENVAHAFCNLSGLCSVIISDKEYPPRVAFGLINRVLEDFASVYPRDRWLTTSARLPFPKAREMLQKFQDPHEADPIMRVQREIDETKVVLVGSFLLPTSAPALFFHL
jgi:synaptobrevin family protein YKT6